MLSMHIYCKPLVTYFHSTARKLSTLLHYPFWWEERFGWGFTSVSNVYRFQGWIQFRRDEDVLSFCLDPRLQTILLLNLTIDQLQIDDPIDHLVVRGVPSSAILFNGTEDFFKLAFLRMDFMPALLWRRCLAKGQRRYLKRHKTGAVGIMRKQKTTDRMIPLRQPITGHRVCHRPDLVVGVPLEDRNPCCRKPLKLDELWEFKHSRIVRSEFASTINENCRNEVDRVFFVRIS